MSFPSNCFRWETVYLVTVFSWLVDICLCFCVLSLAVQRMSQFQPWLSGSSLFLFRQIRSTEQTRKLKGNYVRSPVMEETGAPTWNRWFPGLRPHQLLQPLKAVHWTSLFSTALTARLPTKLCPFCWQVTWTSLLMTHAGLEPGGPAFSSVVPCSSSRPS